MLNDDWRNLANNSPEYNARVEWYSDINNVVMPYKLLFALAVFCVGIFCADHLYLDNHGFLAVLLGLATIACVLLTNKIFDLFFALIPVFIVGFFVYLGCLFVYGFIVFLVQSHKIKAEWQHSQQTENLPLEVTEN